MNLHEQLQRPFPEKKVSWRVGNTNAKKLGCKPWEATEGSVLAYIDARDVMQRLDEVVGSEAWQVKYPLADSGLLICDVGILIRDNWIWKANGAGDTQVEAEKGKCSDAFKRAAVLWGIGRYLYSLPFSWVKLSNGKPASIPAMPKWATPEGYDEIITKRQEQQAERLLSNLGAEKVQEFEPDGPDEGDNHFAVGT